MTHKKPVKLNYSLINPISVYKIFDGKKYQFLGLYPNKKELHFDLQRIHRKYGFDLKFENIDKYSTKVWRRRK